MVREFTVKVKMEERWINAFCSMLKRMEYLGAVGSSRLVSLYSDGDGDFRPEFSFTVDYVRVPQISERDGNIIYDAG